MDNQEWISSFQNEKEKRIKNLINLKEDNNKKKQNNLSKVLHNHDKFEFKNIKLIDENNEGKKNNIKPNFKNHPIKNEILYKNKDVGKMLNINVGLMGEFDITKRKHALSKRNHVNNKIFNKIKDRRRSFEKKESKENFKEILDEIKKENEGKKIKMKKLKDKLNNEEEKYNNKEYLKNLNKKNNKDLKSQKEQIEINNYLSEIEKSKKNKEQIKLLRSKSIEKEEDENEKKINRKRRLKSSIILKKPLYEELKRNKTMDIEKPRFHLDILKNRKNSFNLLNTENNLIKNLINNKIEKPYLLHNNKIEEPHQNNCNLKDNIKFHVNEYKINSLNISQKNKNIKNTFFQSITTGNSIESKGNYKLFNLKGKGWIFQNFKYKNDINVKDLNCYEKGNKIKNVLSEDIKYAEKERKKENDLNLEISSENDIINKENENFKKEKSKENDKNDKLQKENKNIKEELKLRMDEIERLKKEKNDLLLKNEEINKENLEINHNEFENIKKEKIELNKTINNLIEKNEELQKEKKEINNELHKEKEKNKEINNLKLESKDLKEKIKEEIQKYNNLNNKNIELNKENEKIKLELKKYIDEKNNLIKEKEKLYEENSKNKIEIIKYNKENNDLILKKDKIEKQLNELKLSYEHQSEILMEVMNNNPMTLYLKPTLKGLNNIGATCFMNSTLQCLSQTKELTNYFLNQKNKNEIINNNIALENKNNYQLSPLFLELIQKLWDKNGDKSFSPTKFMNTVNDINPLFKTGQAGDAKDFIIFVLEQLHKELRKSVNINNNSISEPLNQYDKNNAFNFFFKDFKNQVSIISDIFYGFNETTNECLNCKNIYNAKGLNNPICYNYGIFNCLIFPLEEIKNFKNNNNYQFNNFQINNSCVSIYDCFQYNQKTELFNGDNRNYCNICKQLHTYYMIHIILQKYIYVQQY